MVTSRKYTTQEAADRLGMRKQTLEVWRVRGGGPAFLKLGGSVRYTEEALDEFEKARTFRSTSEVGSRGQRDALEVIANED